MSGYLDSYGFLIMLCHYRQSRASSSLSTVLDSGTSADESSNLVTPVNTPVLSSAEASATPTPSCAQADRAFRFPKTKKVSN